MATLREVPFGRYYGGVDTTPLFVVLAGAYLKRTNDVAFAERVWPAVQAALDWMDNFGDIDGDGFIEYRRGADGGNHEGDSDPADLGTMEDILPQTRQQIYVMGAGGGGAKRISFGSGR